MSSSNPSAHGMRKPDSLRWKMDNVRLLTVQRMEEHQAAMRKLIIGKNKMIQQYDEKIKEVLTNCRAPGKERDPGDMEEIVRQEKIKARGLTPQKAKPTVPCILNCALSAPIPKDSSERASLAARIQEEKQSLVKEAETDIHVLEMKQKSERRALESTALEILKALQMHEPQALPATPRTQTTLNDSAAPESYMVAAPFHDEEEEANEFDDSNPFDAYFEYQFVCLDAAKGLGLSVEGEEQGLREISTAVASRVFEVVAGNASAAQVGEAELGSAFLLYLQAAKRHLPRLLVRSHSLASLAHGERAVREGETRLSHGVSEVLDGMLEVRGQVKAHCKDKGMVSHACTKCVAEAIGMPKSIGARIDKQYSFFRCVRDANSSLSSEDLSEMSTAAHMLEE